MAIGKDSVARIWRDHGLKPERSSRSAVFCFDVKTQCWALDRTQPSLPSSGAGPGLGTHDYKRNGTTGLFAGSDRRGRADRRDRALG